MCVQEIIWKLIWASKKTNVKHIVVLKWYVRISKKNICANRLFFKRQPRNSKAWTTHIRITSSDIDTQFLFISLFDIYGLNWKLRLHVSWMKIGIYIYYLLFLHGIPLYTLLSIYSINFQEYFNFKLYWYKFIVMIFSSRPKTLLRILLKYPLKRMNINVNSVKSSERMFW